MSRRRLLIGAGAAGVAVIGGLTGWALSSGSSPPAGAAGQGAAGQGAAGQDGTSTGRTSTGGTAGNANNGANSAPASGGSPGAGVAQQDAQPTLPKFAHLAPGQKAWSFATNAPVDANPAVAGGFAYVGSLDNHLYAVDISTGLVAWSYPAKMISAAPTSAAGIVCASGSLGDFYAFKAGSGTLAWQATAIVVTNFRRNWAIDGSKVVIGTDRGTLQVRDAATGAPGRTFSASALFTGAAAVAGGILYGLDLAGTVHAINMSTGTSLWNTSVLQGEQQPAGTGLVRDGDTLYLGALTGGTLYSLNAGTGRINWAYPAGTGIASDPVIADGVVYFTDIRGILHAITAADATKLWTYSVESAGTLGPAVAGGQVYVSGGLSVQSLDAKTGKPGWSYTPGGTTFASTPTVADGLVFIGAQDSNLYAIRA